jgi:predicted outer membrane repeat protein
MSITMAIALAVVAEVRFVDDDAPPNGNGLSWSTAYNDLSHALTDAKATALHVAAGTYTPPSMRHSFMLRDGLAIIGGFGGETILSGDILRNDAGWTGMGMWTGMDDNCRHVVRARNVGPTARLERVTISGGWAYIGGYPIGGGGMFIEDASPTIVNCVFRRNAVISIYGGGGAVRMVGRSAPLIADCTFTRNSAGSLNGGAIMGVGSPTIVRCDFVDNIARYATNLYLSGRLTVIDCTFGPCGEPDGAGCLLGGDVLMVGCAFIDQHGDGAAIATHTGRLHIIATSFINGESSFMGGSAIKAGGGTLTIAGCLFAGNHNGVNNGPGAIWAHGNVSVSITGSSFHNNTAIGGGSAVHVTGGRLRMYGNRLSGNSEPAVVVE